MAKRKKQSRFSKVEPMLWSIVGTLFALALYGTISTYLFKSSDVIALIVTGIIIFIGIIFGWINSREKRNIFSKI